MCGLAKKCRFDDHKTINVVSWSLSTASMIVSLGKILNLNLLCWPEHNLVPVRYVTTFSAAGACTWPFANHAMWGKMIVMISWLGIDIGNSLVSLGRVLYANAKYHYEKHIYRTTKLRIILNCVYQQLKIFQLQSCMCKSFIFQPSVWYQ